MNHLPSWLFTESFAAQILGSLLICLAWLRSLQELRHGHDVPHTRLIMFVITSAAMLATFPTVPLSICYFVAGCFQPIYRDYLRVLSGNVVFIYGFFKLMLYVTKEPYEQNEQHE